MVIFRGGFSDGFNVVDIHRFGEGVSEFPGEFGGKIFLVKVVSADGRVGADIGFVNFRVGSKNFF